MKRIITNYMLLEFRRFLLLDEKSENTISKYLRDVNSFERFMCGKEIDKGGVLKFKGYLAQNYEITSANSIIAAVNAFLRFLGWEDCCTKQFKVQKRTYCPEEKELSKEEYFRLVNAASKRGNERLSLILQTICATGIRVSELEFITVEAVLKGEAVVSCKNKTRHVFIVKQLQKKLLNYIQKNKIKTGCVFVSKRGNLPCRTLIWREMKGLCAAAGVSPQKVFPHNLRHLFARIFYKIERDIAKLADILGHTSINTTRIYIMTTGVEHKQRMENMRMII